MKSESVDHMQGFSSSVPKKKNPACVGGAGDWKFATKTCSAYQLTNCEPLYNVFGVILTSREGDMMDALRHTLKHTMHELQG